jgi:chemotaxis protein histidine kinase CheA
LATASKYLIIFVDEGRELVARLGQRLLNIEERPSDEAALQSSLRLTHTLKGSSKMVGLDHVSRAAHGIENVLKAWAAGELAVDRQQTTRILAILDRIVAVLDTVAAGSSDEALQMEVAVPELVPGGHPPAGGAKGEAPARSEPGPAEAVEIKAAPDSLRIRSDRLDKLQDLVEDLTVQKWSLMAGVSQLKTHFVRLEREGAGSHSAAAGHPQEDAYGTKEFSDFTEDVFRLGALVQELQLSIMDLRMLPFSRLFEEYRRLVRDLSVQLGKDVALEISGDDTEVDRSLLEGVEAPLTHLIRNSVDHGIESPEDRVAAGKPARGVIHLRAYQKPGAVVLEVEDDGKGLDPDELRRTAVERCFLTEEEAVHYTDADIFYLLCRSGFTTRTQADEVSGRGVGLDAVKVRLERMRGSLTITSEKGVYSRFRLFLPQSLSMMRGIVVRANDFSAVFPSLFVEKCLRLVPAEIAASGGFLEYEGESLVPVSLAAIFGRKVEAAKSGMYLVVVNFRKRRMAIAVNRIESEQEIVVKNLGSHLQHVSCVLGVSVLADGEPAPILDVMELYERWAGLENSCPLPLPRPKRRLSVLVVDDAVTSRHVESTILEEMGHSVIEANDGAEALQILEKYKFDLVVTDMEMPRIDGIELVRRIRRMERTANMPVIMISTLSSDEAVDRGYEAGINAYLTKDRLSGPVLRRALKNLFPDA